MLLRIGSICHSRIIQPGRRYGHYGIKNNPTIQYHRQSRQCQGRIRMLHHLSTITTTTTTTTTTRAEKKIIATQPVRPFYSRRSFSLGVNSSSTKTNSNIRNKSSTSSDIFHSLPTKNNGDIPGTNDDSNSTSTRGRTKSQLQSFKVTKMSYTGVLETTNLRTDEILRTVCSVYARDLLTLNLTSKQERKMGIGRKDIDAVISPRKGSIVIAFASIRAVIGKEFVLLFDAHNPIVQEFAQQLAQSFQLAGTNSFTNTATVAQQHEQNHDPAELIVIEKLLHETMGTFNRRLQLFAPVVDSFLNKVSNEVYSDEGVHLMAPLKDSLQSFEISVKQVFDCLTDLLNDDEEMLALLLTEQAEAITTGQKITFSRHEHVEILIGVYARQLHNTLLEIRFLLQRLQSKQEFIALAMAGYRNRMIRMNVNISIAMLSLGVGTTVAGFFGMNLISGIEESPTAFKNVIVGTSLIGLLIGASSINYLSGKSTQRRAMQHLEEIETLSSALSDMGALDYVFKSSLIQIQKGREQQQITAEENGTTIDYTDTQATMDKTMFKERLMKARQSKVKDKEIDFLFDIFDSIKDGQLTNEDYEALNILQHLPK